jgi:hypothetical protein
LVLFKEEIAMKAVIAHDLDCFLQSTEEADLLVSIRGPSEVVIFTFTKRADTVMNNGWRVFEWDKAELLDKSDLLAFFFSQMSEEKIICLLTENITDIEIVKRCVAA